MENHILAYYQQIKNGTVAAGKWIQLIYERIVKGIESGEYIYNAQLAEKAVTWIEAHCFHVEGPLAPGNLKLELWQKAFLSCLFGIVDENGRRQFREAVLVMGRKNGKSALAAGIAKYIWTEDGFGTKIFCVAPKLEQADIIYDGIWQMVEIDPEIQKAKEIADERDEHNRRTGDMRMIPKRRKSDLYIAGTNSSVKKIAFNAKKSDGFNPSLCICDEVAGWEGDKGLKQYEVMKSGMGARPEGLLLSCTTSGYVNESIYDELIKRSTRFLLGDSKEKRLLPVLYMIDDIEKWNDINELRKANPNLGVSVSVDYMLEEIAVAEGSLSKKTEFITKYCNLKQNSSLAWLPAKVVENAAAELNIEDFRDSYCVGGIDLSQTTDLTACCVVIEKDDQLYTFEKFFMPGARIDEATSRDGIPYQAFISKGILQPSGEMYVDYHDCYNWFTEMVEKYQILPLRVGYDRYSAQYLVQDMSAYGFFMDDVFQGDNLYPVIKEVEGIMEENRLHFDNGLLKIHLLDSAIRMNAQRGRGRLVKLRPMGHIDGTAALLDAMTVRQKWWGEIGEQLKNRGD